MYWSTCTEPANTRTFAVHCTSISHDECSKERHGCLQFPDLKRIIIGHELSKHPDLRRTVIRSGVQNDVRFMGFVPIEVLRIFYDAAKTFVFLPCTRASACRLWKRWHMARP